MNNKFLDSQGLQVLWNQIETKFSTVAKITTNTTFGWTKKKNYIPKANELIVYSDYKTISDENGQIISCRPGLKLGDGHTPVYRLNFISMTADSVAHPLKIGDISYDGSQEVTIAVYNGENN